MIHTFNTNIAAQYDVNIAVLLEFIKWHSDHPQGKPTIPQWTEFTHRSFCLIFPYWSSKKIKIILNKLIKLKLIERKEGDPNFYALTSLAISLYTPNNNRISPNGEIVSAGESSAGGTK